MFDISDKKKFESILDAVVRYYPDSPPEEGFKKFCLKIFFPDIVDNDGDVENALLDKNSNRYNISAYLKDDSDNEVEKRFVCSFSSSGSAEDNISHEGLRIFSQMEETLEEITKIGSYPKELEELVQDYKNRNSISYTKKEVKYEYCYFVAFNMDAENHNLNLRDNYSIYSLNSIYKKYKEYEERYSNDTLGRCELTFTKGEEGLAFTSYEFSVRSQSNRKKSVVGALSGMELMALYEKYGTKLFERNVREFLGAKRKDSINAGIVNTAKNNPTHFYFYNNGITITCDRVDCTEYNTAVLTNPNIINGAQTISSIYNAYSQLKEAKKTDRELKEHFAKINVLTRVVETNKGDEAEFAINVTKYNNSQNRVQIQDFQANDSVQKNLHDKLKDKFGYFYENKRNLIYSIANGKSSHYQQEGKYIKVNDIVPLYYAFKYAELPLKGQNIYNSQKYKQLFEINLKDEDAKNIILVHNLSAILHDIWLAVKNNGDEKKYKSSKTLPLEDIFHKKNSDVDNLSKLMNKESDLQNILKHKEAIFICISKIQHMAKYNLSEYYDSDNFYEIVQLEWLQKIMVAIEEKFKDKKDRLQRYISLDNYFKKNHGILDFANYVNSIQKLGFSVSQQFPLD